MRVDLALKHSLLLESRKLVERAKREGQLDLAQTITALSDTLEVEYQQEAQLYIVRTTLREKKIYREIGQKEFEFYQRADSEYAPVRQKNYQPGQDPAATNNQTKVKELLTQLLSEVDTTVPTEIQTDKKLSQGLAAGFDWLAWTVVFMIAGISATLTYYQGTRTFNLIDNTYTLEASWRILNGEVPYRDFNLVVMPGIYVKQAILMKLFSDSAMVGIWWCMIAMFITVLLTHLILKLIETPRWLAVTLCLIAAGGGNIVRPYVWYDVDALLFCLASAALCLWSEKQTSLSKYLFALGFLTALPLIFKQNLGVAHLVVMTVILYVQWAFYPHRFRRRPVLAYHLGIISVFALVIIPFWYWGALSQMLHQTFLLASELRIRDPISKILWDVFPVLPPNSEASVLTYPFPFFSTSFLTWGAITFGLSFWFVGTHRNIFLMLMPFWIFCISLSGIYALGTASIFPLMPLMAIMIALIRVFIRHFPTLSKFSNYVFYPATFYLALILIFHAVAGYQLFFYEQAFGPTTPFQTEKLKGLSSSPEVVTGLDKLVGFVEQLPPDDTIALLPTEDPIYFLANRKSPLKILQRYRQSGGDPLRVYLPELQRVEPTWVIIKTTPQFKYYQPLTPKESEWLKADYKMVNQFNQYLIWKRVDHGKP
jgi:hypothetical protein